MKVLSKSRFKLGLECPNKLYYTGKPTVFPNKKSSDAFLQALANGGFQVEELARMHYPCGIFIDAEPHEYQKASDLTRDALQQENVIIYEAAFLVDGYYVRTDVLVKQKNKIHLIEVKAKSISPKKEFIFKGKRGGLDAGYKPYLYDLAFQKKVAQLAFPDFEYKASFMMADKTKTASIDGMNQLFRVPMGGDPRQGIVKRVNTLAEIGNSVLTEIDVDDIVDEIIDGKLPYSKELNFSDAMVKFRDAYRDNRYLNWQPDFKACKLCEFRASEEEKAKGLISGFEQCFIKKYQWTDKEFKQPSSMEIWNYRGTRSFPDGRILMKDLIEGYVRGDNEARQLLQVEKAINNDMTIEVNKDGLKAEMNRWVFPLHMIDFETSTVALPFTAGRRPYEQVAFQFSHHVIHADGRIEHADEYISNTPGEFPNFQFVRALKAALEHDNGTIFRFATHENTILNAIIEQLKVSAEPDKDVLIDFMKTITVSKADSVDKWSGDRKMVDLKDVVFKYYYNPHTKGSNSIKAVLPAVLNSSAFLQAKYGQSIGQVGVSSSNFSPEHIWLKKDNRQVVNPYKMLPPLFEGWTEMELEENVSEIDGIADGGMALTAYAKLQYQDMTDKERGEITGGLLKYCELDTLAMVMIYEHFKEICP
ncbi:MAG: hypothetical protein RL449_211 [Bacteroidota bacterium]|jgi:hypothetical protein